jgi:hypothetical protein
MLDTAMKRVRYQRSLTTHSPKPQRQSMNRVVRMRLTRAFVVFGCFSGLGATGDPNNLGLAFFDSAGRRCPKPACSTISRVAEQQQRLGIH